jgi:hypothetical protein
MENDMKYTHLLLIALAVVLSTACVSREAKTEAPEQAAPVKPAPPKPAKPAPAKPEAAEIEELGKPAPGSKFAKLKIGMTLAQVEKLIGHPTRQWQHPTGKASIPFYFGPDRWVVQYAYKGEGVLTFNSGGEQLLTQIEVNRAE